MCAIFFLFVCLSDAQNSHETEEPFVKGYLTTGTYAFESLEERTRRFFPKPSASAHTHFHNKFTEHKSLVAIASLFHSMIKVRSTCIYNMRISR